MELSQKALAMLFLGGIPVGAVLHLIYALTDLGALPEGLCKRLICNAKDFIFMLVAGLAAIITVYYVNKGEFRYLIVVGIAVGYVLSHVALGKFVIGARNTLLHLIIVPLSRAWSITFGRLAGKIRARSLHKRTQVRTRILLLLASNGFEN